MFVTSDQRPVEGAERRGLWELQGLVQKQPDLSGEPGAVRTSAHRAPRVQVRCFVFLCESEHNKQAAAVSPASPSLQAVQRRL